MEDIRKAEWGLARIPTTAEGNCFEAGADAALKAILTELEKSYVVSEKGVWMWNPIIVRELIEDLKEE